MQRNATLTVCGTVMNSEWSEISRSAYYLAAESVLITLAVCSTLTEHVEEQSCPLWLLPLPGLLHQPCASDFGCTRPPPLFMTVVPAA